MNDERLEFMGEMKASLDVPQQLGATPHGMRSVLYIREGTVEGPNLRGDVLPGGGDWNLLRSDGVGELDVRATVRTDDGELIYVTYRGLYTMALEALQRWAGGESIDPSETYFRTALLFETASEKYAWLNKTLAVGYGQFTAGFSVCYQIYKVL